MKGFIASHARAMGMAAVLLALGGALAASRLPVALFPHIDYPRVVVAVDAGDRDAAQMAAEITKPVEIGLRGVPGVSRIRSTTSRGSAEVSLDFAWGEDMVAATLATQNALATLLPDLPGGTRFDVRRSDPTVFPVVGFALTSKSLDQEALRQIAELKVRPALTAIEGVAGVDVLGGSAREFEVEPDPAKLSALGISPLDIVTALGKANEVRGVGRLEDRHRLYLVFVDNHPSGVADLAATPLPISGGKGAVVTLGQVASIRPSAAPNFTKVNSNGQDAVLVNVRQALVGDSVRIASDMQARLKDARLPPSVEVTTFYDQSELVTGAAHAVRDAILLGALLAGIVLFLFLRSARLMAITGLVLPAVLATSCLVLYALGMSLNMMTLGGMAAAVGLVVDDAVVMLEHVVRRMQEGAAPNGQSRLAAAAEMSRPLFGSTLATVVVFLPLAFVSGVAGGFFKALAVTMVAVLAISLAYARFIIPLIGAHWLGPRDGIAASRAGGLQARLARTYAAAASRAFAMPVLFATLLGLALAVAGLIAWQKVPSGFMPKMDEGGFVLDYKAQSGAALADTDQLLRQVETIIRVTPEVASYSRRTGVQLGGGLTEADEGDYFIRLKDGSRRPIEAVMADVRDRVQTQVPGLEIETIQLMEDLIGDLTAVPQPIEVKLFGQDQALLSAAAQRVGQALGEIQGVVEIVDGLRVAGDGLRIHVDSGAASQHGLDSNAVASQLEAMIGGVSATRLRVGAQLIGARVRAPGDLRDRAARLGQIPLTAPDGHLVRLSQIATISVAAGQLQLTSEDLAPFIAVTARLEGRDLGSAMKEVRTKVAGLHLPPSIRVDYGGLYAEQQKSFAELALVFVAALLLSAFLLTALFERFDWTVATLATVLLSAAAVVCGLWVTGTELDVSALMGLTMVVGMVTELAIFYLAELDRTATTGTEMLREAGNMRLRPILMSATIAILALSPLALGIGRGAGLQQSMATAIIFGLAAAVPLVLLFLPAMLLVLHRRRTTPEPR